MRAFITGGHGFVGKWLTTYLQEVGDTVYAPDSSVDITDRQGLAKALESTSPDVIYHLAAFTHVGQSWEHPEKTFEVNALGTLHLLEAARHLSNSPKVILVSSSEVYGAPAVGSSALSEDAPLAPISPYAASKVAAEFLGVQAYLGYGLPVVRARPFNHVGPGQTAEFAVSALARRIVEAERKGLLTIPVGNLTPRRDFTDVRDVVRAYRALAVDGRPGEVYNVCSGQDVAISEIVQMLLKIAGVSVDAVVNQELVRPVDIPIIRGDASLIKATTGWRPEIPLANTLSDVLEYWRAHL